MYSTGPPWASQYQIRDYIIDCNPAYEEMLGYSKEELRERFPDIPISKIEERNRDLQRQLAEGLIDKYQIEKRYIRKDGTANLVHVDRVSHPE